MDMGQGDQCYERQEDGLSEWSERKCFGSIYLWPSSLDMSFKIADLIPFNRETDDE